MVSIKKCSILELWNFPEFPALEREYTDECALKGLPDPAEKMVAYRNIEASGFLQPFGAFLDGALIGFMAVLTPVIPHYGVALSVTESLFVGKEHRKTGAGLKLLAGAEQHASDCKSAGILVSAPFGGPLMEVLPNKGYRETNRVFFKNLP